MRKPHQWASLSRFLIGADEQLKRLKRWEGKREKERQRLGLALKRSEMRPRAMK